MDSDGITNEVECAGAESNFLLNGSFETPAIPPGTFRTFVPSADFRWRTTASDGRVEVWNNFADGGSVPTPLAAADGAQIAELNANVPSALYQDVTTSPGDIYVWALAHRGRAGVDVMSLQIGAPGAPDQVVSISDGNTAWGQHEGAYLVPPGQTVTRFQFEATASASGSLSIGNFLDAIDFTPCPDTDGDGIGDFADPDSDADGFPDLIEGTDDDDGDSVPNWRDPRSPTPPSTSIPVPTTSTTSTTTTTTSTSLPRPTTTVVVDPSAASTSTTDPGQLPATGSRSLPLVIIALVTLLAGAVILAGARFHSG